ncbi:hypothetical protein [Celeribacter ethanolicus]|uniref:50S ribosomal protein L35 n=1 Tax=Celeribacter ethanolicus TaxID=1758178 RepID=A0A291GCZ7_9RHOB|nr:hypothetical protein [Celeribacter ethanolicus]ATG48018.1 hypothetical protein CEW89_10870 [Celeribacter ethanolicus]TNE68515.1 MAG: hypothetical protein EP336_04735 [Paracoccaceae bacterium]
MDTDLFLVLGSLLCCLALTSAASAFSESRRPRTAIWLVLIGGGMVLSALLLRPGGYAFAEFPEALIRVLGRFF